MHGHIASRPVAASHGNWWRFSEYEVANGWIRPVAGAKLERYDPWADFWESRHQTVGQPPYWSLIKLVQEFKYKPGPRRDGNWLSDQSLGDIATWCQRHGPLGILLSRWEAISLAPVPVKDLFLHQRYLRGAGKDVRVIQSRTDKGDVDASVLIHDLDGLDVKEEPPGTTWYRFFPSVYSGHRNLFQYPKPYLDEFCDLYAEHVFDFCKAARYLTGAMMHLGSDPPVVDHPELAREQAREAINLLRRPVTSVVDFDEAGNLKTSWEAPSLLATFAEMYVQDLLYGRPVLTCACCGIPFVSSAYQAQYCSLACRYRGQKRRVRKEMKEAKALHSAGQTAEQISATLGQKQEVVAAWLKKA